MKPIPKTTDEALGRVYAQNCWSLAGMTTMLQQMQDLWGVDTMHAQTEIKKVRSGLDEVWHSVRER